jgi:universal stress protein E
MRLETLERTRIARKVPMPVAFNHRYRDVAFVASGRPNHRRAALERAVWLTEKSEINLTPLERVTESTWESRYDLAIAGAEEPWGFRDAVLGNSEREIVRNSPNDVLIVKDWPFAPTRRIVVALDPDAADPRRNLLAAETIKAAAAFADWSDSELHVVNVIPAHRYYMLALRAGLPATDAGHLDSQARLEQHERFDRFLAALRVDRSRIKTHLLEGKPDQKIINLVARLEADLLVIGSTGKAGIERLLMGNIAERVMRQVTCSYLVVKTAKAPR